MSSPSASPKVMHDDLDGHADDESGPSTSHQTAPAETEDDETSVGVQPPAESEVPQPELKNSGRPSKSRGFTRYHEIKALQTRLLYLEDQAAQSRYASLGQGENEAGETEKVDPHKEDRELRKYIRRARSGKRLVNVTERHAEETAEARKQHGHDPNQGKLGEARNTMHHVRESGDMSDTDENGAIYGPNGWYGDHRSPYYLWDDVHVRRDQKPYPHRGMRPPASVRNFYEKPERGFSREGGMISQGPGIFPLELSRKLGPPTKWDQSDSGEWSSDTSTRSQDFRYFRARLRGDFEWELDRLNAQVLRYNNHKNKKTKKRLLATKTEQENKRKSGIDGEGKFLQSTDLLLSLALWPTFQLRRKVPEYVIDVLVEEPRLSSLPFGRKDKVRSGEKDKMHMNLRSQVANLSGNKAEENPNWKQELTTWAAEKPLPERIRVNSTHIIEMLSSIHGSSMGSDDEKPSSLVLLRPFRILNAYEKDIRERTLKLAGQTEAVAGEKVPVEVDASKQQEASETSRSNEEPNEKANEATLTIEEMAERTDQLKCLCEFMDKFLAPKATYLNSVSYDKVFFPDLWFLFQPGTDVISADGKQAYRVISVQSKRHKGVDRWADLWNWRSEKSDSGSDSGSSRSRNDARGDFVIKCVYIHFDGRSIGPVLKTFSINKWEGEKDITYLEIFPLRFLVSKRLKESLISSTAEGPADKPGKSLESGIRELREKLVERGRKFVEVAGVKQMYYAGFAADTHDEIESQVMVDFGEALSHKSRSTWIPKIRRITGAEWLSNSDDNDEKCTADCCWEENVHDDSYVEVNNAEKYLNDLMAEVKDTPHRLPSAIIFPRSLEDIKTEENALKDDELMLMSYCVFGFVLRDRSWGES